jgi:hypothetical protein
MFRDEIRKEVHDRLREHDLKAVADKLTPDVFSEAARRTNLRIATCPLNLVNLVWLGIAAAWRKTESFATILTITLKLLQDQEHFGQSIAAVLQKDVPASNACWRRSVPIEWV